MNPSAESNATAPGRRVLDAESGIDDRALAAMPSPAAALAPSGDARDVQPPAAPPSTAAHAAAAIEAAVAALDHARSAGRSSVELHLSFGDATQLAVRVELRDGTVHTTFRTDSPELQHALAQEWRVSAPSFVSSAQTHSVPVADPVFVRANPAAGSLNFSGDGQPSPHQAPSPAPEILHHPASVTSVETADTPSATSTIQRTPGAILLNTFA